MLDIDGYYVYLLLCEDGSYYCGYTTNLKKRYQAHISGKAAKYTKAHKVKALYYYESFDNKSDAMKREYQIKQLTHQQKQALKKVENML